MGAVRINNRFGRLTGWANLTVNQLGRDLEGIVGISYGNQQMVANEYAAGSDPIGFSVGNYETDDVVIRVLLEEWLMLSNAAGKGKRLFDIPAFNVVAGYDYANQTYKDICQNCKIKRTGKSWTQGDGKVVIEIVCNTTNVIENAP
jgi:hypothetical protein